MKLSSDPEIRALEIALDKKKRDEKTMAHARHVDPNLLESFGYDPGAHDVRSLSRITSACVRAVEDGRIVPTDAVSYRLHVDYKNAHNGLKLLVQGITYAKLMGMLYEALITGDIRIAKQKHSPKNRRAYGEHRFLFLDREGNVINPTLREDRPYGTKF